ncbi:hypothetical protein ACIA8K_07140 [Catenuloplanes sp. NPDC051500]|uniref:hypothetical protein n=1 Tax=Catenuloplanes sp. NPDC051500 TaxID=3363959 RepID=UPI0037B319CD
MRSRLTWYALGAAALLVVGATLAGPGSTSAGPTATTGGEPQRGWGGPIAIVIAAVLAWAMHRGVQWWRENGTLPIPSPKRAIAGSVRKKPQVKAVSVSGVKAGGTTGRRRGRFVELGDGAYRRVDDEDPLDRQDDEINLALDDNGEQGARQHPAGPPESLDQYVDRLDRDGVARKDIRADAMERFRTSQSSVDRALKRVRDRRTA